MGWTDRPVASQSIRYICRSDPSQYDRSAYVRGRRRGGGQRCADFDRPHTDSPHHRDDDGYNERPRCRRNDDRCLHVHNRREPFDQPLLLERCRRDIRNLFPMNPNDEFESQTPSSSSVATSYTTASFVVPRVSQLSPAARTSTVTRATITPSSAQMVSQPVKSTAAASAKSVCGVTE